MADEALEAGDAPTRGSTSGRRTAIGLAAAAGLIVIYYLGGMLWLHTIDDDPTFGIETSAPVGGSRSVAVAADLIDREININRWVANDPFFMPASLLDNMPNFQRGIIAAISRFTLELADQIARTRGSSQIDANLDLALGLLKYPGTVWIFDFSTSWAPTASSESQYRRAMGELHTYNERLAMGEAVFERRSDNLLQLLDRMGADLGSASAALFDHIETNASAWIDWESDDLFYANKGKLYAYSLILRDLGLDFSAIMEERDLTSNWSELLRSLEAAAALQPYFVMDAPLDAQMRPNHLGAQGFLLLRARTQLKEISNILLK